MKSWFYERLLTAAIWLELVATRGLGIQSVYHRVDQLKILTALMGLEIERREPLEPRALN